VKTLRAEARQLKEALAEATLENRLLKKSVIGDGEDTASEKLEIIRTELSACSSATSNRHSG
jgi:hypothetical protein